MAEYNLNWLKKKGFFRKSIPLEVKGKEILVDERNLLAYVEAFSNEEIKEIKRELLSREAQKVKYIWFFFPVARKIKVFRKTGEVKWFYYSAEMRSDYLKSRINKLDRFSPDNMNILFDIRDIVEKFYWQLWKHRILMARSIKELKEDKNKLLAVQHLIDRLIFFYFLAQLKLVKVKNEEREWILDRKNTREFFKWICDQLSESDLQKFLNKIFFDVLGQVKESGFISEEFVIGKERFSIVSPCLNGGLFIEEKIEGIPEGKIRIPGIKKLILEVLNSYNWIIGEEFPEEEDVIGDLTPEIIGHIYEKFVVSLEQIGIGRMKLKDVKTVKEELRYGRKRIGAYYTPEEITNYISMNTIYPYIRDKLKEKFGKDGEALLDNLFKKNNFNKQELEIIKHLYFKILTKIKICDNACGSGSFLIAAGDVLLRLYSRVLKILEDNLSDDKEVREVLKDIGKSPTRNYYIVRQIIVNNLYGVDIMEGAVEIAKLRFWLWLISQVDPRRVKGKKIETLPNLDFNLMVGNTLIGFVDIEDIEFDFIPVRPKKRWETLTSKQYLITTWTDRDKVKWLKELVKQKQKFKTLPAHKAMKLKKELNSKLEEAREFLNEKFYNILKAKGVKISKEEFLKLKPFHWGFEFYEVFDLEKSKEERGFDVIIGNPPYLRQEKIKKEKPIYSILFRTFESTADLFVYFIEKSIEILHKKGYFSYIVSNKWLRTKYAVKLRRFLLSKTTVLKIIDFAGIKVFSDPTVDVCIFVLKKDVTNKNHKIFCTRPNSIENLTTQINQEGFYLDQSYLENSEVWSLYRSEILEIKEWIERVGKPLKELDVKIKFGIKTGFNKAFIIDEKTRNKLIKRDPRSKEILVPILRGRDIYRYYIKWPRLYLILSKSGVRIDKKYPAVFEYLKQYEVQLKKRWDKGKYWFNLRECAYYEDFEKPKIIWQEISEKGSYYWDEEGFFVTNTAYIMTNAPKYFVLILNSKLMDFYFEKIAYSLSEKGLRHIYQFVELQPIRKPSNPKIFEIITSYMLFLNATEERRTGEKELIEFIDKQIIDSLVYELYFKEKFEEDGIKTNLLELVEPYLKDISNLNSDEEKLETIKKVIGRIKNDKKIMEQIEKIKSHLWVKVVEGG